MAWNTAERIQEERARLAAGTPPEHRMKHTLQRKAAKALAGFFVLMLVLTLLSRAAYGITVARVETEKSKSGILTQRCTITGAIQAMGDLTVDLPEGLEISRITAVQGQAVQAGDTLLELDRESLDRAVETLEQELALLDLKISNAAKGQTSAGTDAVLTAQDNLATAQTTLKRAQEDYERLTESRGVTEDRAAQDLTEAQDKVTQAEAELAEAEVKAKEALVKAAQEALEAAKDNLETVKESASEAEDAAQQALATAEDQQTSTDSSYIAAVGSYNRAEEAVKQAQADLDAALAQGDEAVIAAARTALLQAQDIRDQAEANMNSLAQSSNTAYNAVKRAKENLKKVQEKWKEKVTEAEAKVTEAEEKLKEAEKRTDMSEETLVVTAQSALNAARQGLQSAQRSAEDAASATEEQLLTAQRAIESAQQGVESAQRGLESAQQQAENDRRTDAASAQQAEIERLGYVSQRREKQETLDILRAAQEAEGRITAPIGGTVKKIRTETGVTQAGEQAAVLSRGDLGYQFTGTLDQKEAEQLAVGDEGTLSFTSQGKSQSAKVTITSISGADDKGQVTVTAALEGSGWAGGASAKLEITKRSEQYGTTLPLGALRSGQNGEFVLVLREKQTVMGTEQTVAQVPVTVKARDSERVAVEADGLLPEDRVVVSSSKPIDQGDRVRVLDETA